MGYYLAFDLGAESGRAIVGRFHEGRLELEEIHRFPNTPLREPGSLRWDAPALAAGIEGVLNRASLPPLDGAGVDTWGVDYALVGRDGALVENPFHYRDSRTDGVMPEVFREVSRERIYDITGIQFLPFNTIYQLYAACRLTPASIERAHALLTIPDYLHYRLTGRLFSEYTNASTTQLVDARSRAWSSELIQALRLPLRLFPPIVQPGTPVGELKSGAPVIAPASHDTGSAVAAIPLSPETAYLSSGTWSLLGAEVAQPVITAEALQRNFTNEGGVCGTIRLLKNIAGLWLLQSCRRSWQAGGREYSYEELHSAAADQRYAFQAFFDPDHESFLKPPDMAQAIAAYCETTGQAPPAGPAAITRAILENLAFKYRLTLEALEELTGVHYREIRIVGGGSRNRLLNQFTANATGRTVVAGPVEATALGNIVMQMLATGAVKSLAEGRAVVDHSFPAERFQPEAAARWDAQFARFRELTA